MALTKEQIADKLAKIGKGLIDTVNSHLTKDVFHTTRFATTISSSEIPGICADMNNLSDPDAVWAMEEVTSQEGKSVMGTHPARRPSF